MHTVNLCTSGETDGGNEAGFLPHSKAVRWPVVVGFYIAHVHRLKQPQTMLPCDVIMQTQLNQLEVFEEYLPRAEYSRDYAQRLTL